MYARNLRNTGQVGTRIGHTKVSVLQRKAQVPSEFRGRGNTLAHVRLEHVMYECPADLQGEPRHSYREALIRFITIITPSHLMLEVVIKVYDFIALK